MKISSNIQIISLELEVAPNSTTKTHKYHLITRDIRADFQTLPQVETNIIHISKVINGTFSSSSMHGPWLTRLTKKVG